MAYLPKNGGHEEESSEMREEAEVKLTYWQKKKKLYNLKKRKCSLSGFSFNNKGSKTIFIDR